jgi:hypothetical protein
MNWSLGKVTTSTILALNFVLLLNVIPALAVTFRFKNIATNKASEKVGDSIVNQFNFEVTKVDNTNVLLKFQNTGEDSSFIAQIYFDSPTNLLSNLRISNQDTSTGVRFSSGGSPSNLPQGNNINFTADLRATANNPAPKNGINSKEFLGILLSGNYNNILSSLESEQLRVGIHVQGIGVDGGGSDSYVNNLVPIEVGGPSLEVPEPNLVIALFSIALLSWQLKLKNNRFKFLKSTERY